MTPQPWEIDQAIERVELRRHTAADAEILLAALQDRSLRDQIADLAERMKKGKITKERATVELQDIANYG